MGSDLDDIKLRAYEALKASVDASGTPCMAVVGSEWWTLSQISPAINGEPRYRLRIEQPGYGGGNRH